jgi:hypothetical protein
MEMEMEDEDGDGDGEMEYGVVRVEHSAFSENGPSGSRSREAQTCASSLSTNAALVITTINKFY